MQMSIFVIENVCKTRCHSIGDPKGIFINILSRYATKTRIAIYFVQPWPSFSVITFFQFLNISIYPSYLYLTPNTWAILPSLTWSKWNMVEICGLKFHLSLVFCCYNCLDLPWEKFFQVWVTCFPSSWEQEQCWEKVVQIRGRRPRICDLFKTLFLLERTGKTSNEH